LNNDEFINYVREEIKLIINKIILLWKK
jgi:hypothetical protein